MDCSTNWMRLYRNVGLSRFHELFNHGLTVENGSNQQQMACCRLLRFSTVGLLSSFTFTFAGKDEESMECYKKTEQKIALYTKRCIAVVTTVATGCFLVPICVALFKIVRGKYSRDVWFYPLKVV